MSNFDPDELLTFSFPSKIERGEMPILLPLWVATPPASQLVLNQ